MCQYVCISHPGGKENSFSCARVGTKPCPHALHVHDAPSLNWTALSNLFGVMHAPKNKIQRHFVSPEAVPCMRVCCNSIHIHPIAHTAATQTKIRPLCPTRVQPFGCVEFNEEDTAASTKKNKGVGGGRGCVGCGVSLVQFFWAKYAIMGMRSDTAHS